MTHRTTKAFPLFTRRMAVLLAFVCMGLTILLVVNPFSGMNGTILASPAMAEVAGTPAPSGGKPAATVKKGESAAAHDEPTSATAGSGSLFLSDPLQSLASALHRKEAELQQRETVLAERERNVEAIRLETQQTLERIELVRRQMETISAAADQQRQKQLKKWIEIYQKMDPTKVAPLMMELDTSFQLDLLGQMEPGKAAKVLNAFPADKAAEIGRKLNH